MSISAVQQAQQVETGQNISTGSEQLGKLDFLQLMVMQMRYQDPLSPMDNTEFITQLAQFNSLEQMQNLNSSVSKMAQWMHTSQASSMIGKEVDVIDANSGESVSGTVAEVRIRGGEARLVVGEHEVLLSDVVSIY